MSTSRPSPGPPSGAERPPESAPAQAHDGRGMGFAKQASVVVGLVSGVIGLFFLFFPQFRPERHQPPPDQSAAVTKMELNPRVTQGNYLDYADQKKDGFT